MAKRTAPLLPATQRHLSALGERIRLARLRRKLPARQVAERAGMAVNTLRALESGHAGVTLGAYAAVLQVLRLESQWDQLLQEDPAGRVLQDSRLRGAGKSARPLAVSAKSKRPTRMPQASQEEPSGAHEGKDSSPFGHPVAISEVKEDAGQALRKPTSEAPSRPSALMPSGAVGSDELVQLLRPGLGRAGPGRKRERAPAPRKRKAP